MIPCSLQPFCPRQFSPNTERSSDFDKSIESKDSGASGTAPSGAGTGRAQLPPTALTKDHFYDRLLATPDSKLPSRVTKVHIEVVSYEPPDEANVHSSHVETSNAVEAFNSSNSSSSSSSSGSGSSSSGSGDGLMKSPASPAQKILGAAETDFLVLSSLGGGEAKKMACNPSMRYFKLLPSGSIAVCMSRSRSGKMTEATAAVVGAREPGVGGDVIDADTGKTLTTYHSNILTP